LKPDDHHFSQTLNRYQPSQPFQLIKPLKVKGVPGFFYMLDHAKEAINLLAGKEKAAFLSDRVLQLALVRLVEIVGEAANRLSMKDRGCP